MLKILMKKKVIPQYVETFFEKKVSVVCRKCYENKSQ